MTNGPRAALMSLLGVVALVGAACGGDDTEDATDTTAAAGAGGELVIYSRRDEELVARLIDEDGRPRIGLVEVDAARKESAKRMPIDNEVIREGAQIEVGGNEKYVSYCRRHWDDVMNPDGTK